MSERRNARTDPPDDDRDVVVGYVGDERRRVMRYHPGGEYQWREAGVRMNTPDWWEEKGS